MAVYHATKAFVLSFSEALHHELHNAVRVTALCPGPFDSEFNERAGLAANYLPRFFNCTAERVAEEGYEGFMQGRPLVVPGLGNKVLIWLPRLFSRQFMLERVARQRQRRAKAKSRRWQRRAKP
jgi:short-subunit dehydrogenase